MANAVSIKLPTFWAKRPNIWFAQAEAQFDIQKITQENTKYSYLVAALDEDSAIKVGDFLDNPPEEERYTKLKDRLTQKLVLSEQERADKLLHLGQLGDRRPSQLMTEVLALCGTDHGLCFIAKQAFLQALPLEVRLAMDGVDFTDPHKAAAKADSLWCTHQQELAGNITVSGISKKTKTAKQKKNPEFCYYHDTFGELAAKCKAPCSYKTTAVNTKASHQ